MPGWSYLMPILIFLPPPDELLLLLLLFDPQAVAPTARASTAAEAAVTLRSFMVNILWLVKREAPAVAG
jgi:hypothetical protein